MDASGQARLLLSEALDCDGIGLGRHALTKYLTASQALLAEPKQTIDQIVFEDDFVVRGDLASSVKQSLVLVEKCVNRAVELLSEEHASGDAEDREPPAELSRSSSVCSSGSGSGSVIQSPLRKSLKSVPRPRGSVTADLSAVRKLHERAHLATIIARQRQQEAEIAAVTTETTHAHSAIRPKLVDMQIVTDLINQRQVTYSRLNDRLFSLFDGFTARVRETRTRSIDGDVWRRTLKLSVLNAGVKSDAVILQPLTPIVRLMLHHGHPIAQLVHDFVVRLRHFVDGDSGESSAEVCGKIAEEYHQFSFHLVKLLRHNYADELCDDAATLPLLISIEHVFFALHPALAAGIFRVLRAKNATLDAALSHQTTRLVWRDFEHADALFDSLGIKDKYRLHSDTAKSPYDAAIAELRLSTTLQTPTAKALSLVHVCELICTAVETHHREQREQREQCEQREQRKQQDTRTASVESIDRAPSDDDLAIGSEDLVLLFSYVLIRAQIPTLITEFASVSEFLTEDLIRGQAGYVLATLQTCLDHIQSLQ